MKTTKVIRDDNYGKLMTTKKWNNGDWNLRLMIHVQNMTDTLTEAELKDTGKYWVSIIAVSPEAAGEKHVQEALENLCDDMEYPLKEYEALVDYGIYATLWNRQGNNLKKLLSEANKELLPIQSLFGFYMDRPENRIGNTGWDFIRGKIG